MNPFITCLICKQTFEQPVILPCSHSVCKKHEQDSKNGDLNQISCPKCNKVHEIPENGFISNSLAEDLIKYKFDRQYQGAEHKAAKETCDYLKELVDEFKRLRANPELKITHAIDEMRNRIDLKREVAKQKIDDEALKLSEELNEYEAKRKAGLNGNKLVVSSEIEEFVESLESDRSKWEEELKSFELNLRVLKSIHVDSIAACEKLRPECDRIKKSLFTDEFKKLVRKQKLFCGENSDALM